MMNQRNGSLLLASVLGLLLGFASLLAEDASPNIVLTSPEDPEERSIEVSGLPVEMTTQFARWKRDDPRWRESFAVYVGKDPQPDQPAMLGSFESVQNGFRFVPRFPLEAGTDYTARLMLPGQNTRTKTLTIPADVPGEPATVSAVYPTGKKLPENLLRIYIHFSAPMSQGKSYRHLHLFDQSGEEVENPFLELPQELWSRDGKRLTVLLDPGRVKEGLKPREQSGPVLVPERRYTFRIDEDWLDAQGRPLDKAFQRTFLTTKADVSQPNPTDWKLQPPKAGTREPFSVRFDEPLDHGMLQRVLSVQDAEMSEIEGEIQVDREEIRWRFTPEERWKPGKYHLRIRTHLEDRVGNSIARPFEVDLNEAPPPEVPKVITKEFVIRP